LWCSVGLSTVGLTLMRVVNFQLAAFVGGLLAICFGVLLTFWCTAKLKRGRNWMRLLLSILTVLGILLMPFTWTTTRRVYMATYAGRPAMLAVGVTVTAAQYVLTLMAVALINTGAARAWCRPMLRDQ